MSPIYLVYDERMTLHFDQEEFVTQKKVQEVETTNSNRPTGSNNHYPPELLTEAEESSSSDRSSNQSTKTSNFDHNDTYKYTTVENPHRITYIYNRLNQLDDKNNNKLFIRLPSCPFATKDQIILAHSSRYYDKMAETQDMSSDELRNIPTIDCTNQVDDDDVENDDDMYFCKDTFQAALLACGGVIESVNKVTQEKHGGESTSTSPNITNNTNNNNNSRALALVRPPGHHACTEKAMGFCFFNSIVVAAKHALNTKRASKVLILDWDIHHGNGSQELTYDDENIMYISLHRYTKGTQRRDPFFPGTGLPTEVGLKDTNAHGMNLNIAWNASGMGNCEYAAAFSELILPIVSKLSPDLVLISCGLDAADGDLLGDCELTPYMYYVLTKCVMTTVGVDVPIVVALEGGYNLEVISDCMEAVACALLDLGFSHEEEDQQQQQQQDEMFINQEEILPQDQQSDHSFMFTPGDKKLDLNQNDKGEDCARLIKLEKGRDMLTKFWKSKVIKMAAIRDINKSICAIEGTKWNGIGIKKLKQNVVLRKSTQGITTRSSSKEQNKSDDVDVIDMFQSLHL